ncbi:MAG: TrmH family RNA methyltransferase [Candidatus Gastranaerophilaceae bacterium]
MEITSVNNETIKEITKLQQKKYRDETKLFLLEGLKAIEEAYNADIEIEQIFVLKEKAFHYDFLEEKIVYVTEPVLHKLATTDTAPEAVAVGRQKQYSEDILQNSKRVALFENIKDLGNLGTILRTATAFALDAIILYGNTVDLYNPKCVRASVGNLWKTPVFQIKDFNVLQQYFKDFTRIATLPKSEDSVFLKDFKPQEKTLVMFGAESDGLSQELTNYANAKVTIEMNSKVESLNLSMSAGIIFYKLFLL